MKVCETVQKTVWHTGGDHQWSGWPGSKLPVLIARWSSSVPPPPPPTASPRPRLL